MRRFLSNKLSESIQLGMKEVEEVMGFSKKRGYSITIDENKPGNIKTLPEKDHPNENPLKDINKRIVMESINIKRVGKFRPKKEKLVDSLLLILPLDRLVSHLNNQTSMIEKIKKQHETLPSNNQMRMVKKIEKKEATLRRLKDYDENICHQPGDFHQFRSFENIQKELKGKIFQG